MCPTAPSWDHGRDPREEQEDVTSGEHRVPFGGTASPEQIPGTEVRAKQNKVEKQVHGDHVVTVLKHHGEAEEKLGLVISGCFADPAGITQGTSTRIAVAPCTCVYYFFGLPTFTGLNI